MILPGGAVIAASQIGADFVFALFAPLCGDSMFSLNGLAFNRDLEDSDGLEWRMTKHPMTKE